MRPSATITIISATAISLLMSLLTTALSGCNNAGQTEASVAADSLCPFLDIEHRRYQFYASPTDDEIAQAKMNNKLLPYVYIVDKRYSELRISKADAEALGVDGKIYDRWAESCRRSKGMADTIDQIIGMESFEKYYDAIRAGLINPDDELRTDLPRLPSIRQR